MSVGLMPVYSYEAFKAAHDCAEASPEDAFFAAGILNVDMWDGPDEEVLRWTDIDEAIEGMLDDCDPLPKTLTLVGYRRRTLDASEPDPDHLLERIAEDLDDEYGGGDDMTEWSPKVMALAKALTDAIHSEYEVWQCEPVHAVTVNVEAWLRARPEPHEIPEITDADLEGPPA